MTNSFSDLQRRSRLMNKRKLADRFGSDGGSTSRVTRQKLADGGAIPPRSAAGWENPPVLPSLSIDSSEGRRGSTDFRASYSLGDVDVSGNYQKNTDGGKDTYGGRITFRKSFAAGGPIRQDSKQREAKRGGRQPKKA